ncbi:MAG: hypothetical protein HKN62_04700 [Phycisphaerales bacterium]|nr:hypothetical protein [Phycisphaerales bacterium]
MTLDHYLYFGDSSLILTDLTNDVILFSWNGEFKGTQQLQLAADTLYEYSSSTNNGSSSLTIRCAADLDASGDVGFSDLLAVLSTWGESGVLEDLDGSGMVDFADLLIVLANWGPCK